MYHAQTTLQIVQRYFDFFSQAVVIFSCLCFKATLLSKIGPKCSHFVQFSLFENSKRIRVFLVPFHFFHVRHCLMLTASPSELNLTSPPASPCKPAKNTFMTKTKSQICGLIQLLKYVIPYPCPSPKIGIMIGQTKILQNKKSYQRSAGGKTTNFFYLMRGSQSMTARGHEGKGEKDI